MTALQRAKSDQNDSSVAKTHPQLYHYTTLEGLKGIIENNSFWATYFGDLNDANEVHEIRSSVVLALAERLVPFIKEFRKRGFRENKLVSKQGGNSLAAQQLARTWANALYRTTFDAEERQGLCCITSFCSHSKDQAYERENGLLSQWRGYGKDGGYCIVLDTTVLAKQLEMERNSFFYLYADLREAHYPIEGATPTDLFKDLIRLSESVITAAVSGEKDIGAAETFIPFVGSASTFKHRGFYEEREVRMVTMPATKLADERIKHLEGYKPEPLKESFTSERDGRRRLHISLFGKNRDRLPIKRIIVGPSRNQEANFELAKKTVGSSILVSKSETPFVG